MATNSSKLEQLGRDVLLAFFLKLLAIAVHRCLCKRLFGLGLIGFLFVIGATNTLAQDVQIAKGMAWLQGQVLANGELKTEAASIALPFQARSETTQTFEATGIALSPALVAATQNATTSATVEVLARRMLVMRAAGKAVGAEQAQLLALQNEEGGFGAAKNHSSNPFDTAWALLALETSQINTVAAHNAVSWLLGSQSANGRWLVAADEVGVATTALTVQALQRYRAFPGVAAAQSKARTWIAQEKQTDQSWGRADMTAQALLAVLPGQTNADAYAPTVAHLKAIQSPDGSWLGDAYVTALVLRALQLAVQPVTNPDFARMRGVVLDDSTGLPIQGAQVSLQHNAASAITDQEGAFLVSGLHAGPDVLTVSAGGYRVLTANMQFQTAQVVDLGEIRLRVASGTGSSNVMVSGVLQYLYGANTVPVRNATVTVGSLTTQTNSLGEYVLTGVPAGAFDFIATYSGYPTVRVGMSGQAGQHLLFNHVFEGFATTSARVNVAVTAEDTGLPLRASVNLNGSSSTVAVDGTVTRTTPIYAGNNRLQVSMSGYEGALINFTIDRDDELDLPVALKPVVTANPMVVRGVVTDAATGLPLDNVAVAVEGVAGASAVTDAQGQYSISSPPNFQGTRKLIFEKSGYYGSEAPMTFSLHTTHTVDAALRVFNATAGPGTATTVTISGVAKYLSGTNQVNASGAVISVGGLSTRSNALGEYRLDGVAPGALTINATYSSYPAISANASALAGQHIRFDPVFTLPASNTGVFTGRVTHQSTGAAIPGASVRLNGSSKSTDANGEVTFPAGASGLRIGDNTVEIAAVGFEGQIVKLTVPVGQDVSLPIALKPAVVSNQTILQGVVTDAATRLPMAGATVTVDAVAGMVTQTDAQGRYRFASPPQFNGSRKIVFEKAGYYTHDQTIQITTNRTHNLDVPLQPVTQSGAAASLSVRVGDRSTGQPLPNATVTLSGANSQSLLTDANGDVLVANLNVGDTQIRVAATGFDGVIANVSVVSGRQYQLPVELAPQTSTHIRLFGTVLDANSQAPLAGAQIMLTGAASLSATSDANGQYVFNDLAAGDWQMALVLDGYQSFTQPLTIAGTTEANIPLSIDYGTGDPSLLNWGVFASVVDADSLETLGGAHVLVQEVVVGQAVLSESSQTTLANGTFEFNGLVHDHARLFITMPGYDSLVVPLSRTTQSMQYLGHVRLKRSYVANLPDLQLGSIDRAALVVDPYTFIANGQVSAEVLNNSNYSAGAFDVALFEDVNWDGEWQFATDRLLGKVRIDGLNAQGRQSIAFDLSGAQLAFRDAPLYVMVDASHEVIESIDGNNTRRVAVSCAGGGGLQDVAICLDASGSVSAALYQIEMEGTIAALENPNIIPHDGSIRFTLDTAYNRVPLHEAVVVSPSTLPQLINNLRTKPRRGGASSGAQCTRSLSEYLLTQPASTRKTLITIGDGEWEGVVATQALLPGTVANGIARIDAIGVGAVPGSSRSQLEANVWPQPPNSPNGGRVTIANSTGEVAAAIAQAMAASIQSVDLTLGNFRLIDQGAGQALKLAVRVGNAGAASQATTVEMAQGGTVLGILPVPALHSGEWIDLELETQHIVGTDLLRAVVDPQGLNGECNIANNYQDISLEVSNALASITVATDRAVYPAHTPVTLSGVIGNLGSFDANVWLSLQVVDANNDAVASFSPQDLGTVAYGGSTSHAQSWNTASFPAGTYTLQGQVLDANGNELDTDSTVFVIVAGATLDAPVGALTVGTDKALYSPDDRVRLDHLARNLTQNAHIEDARVEWSVVDSSGATSFSDTVYLGQLVAGSLRAFDTLQPLRNVPLGHYTVTAKLYGSGHSLKSASSKSTVATKAYVSDLLLATATTHYEVGLRAGPDPDPGPGLNPGNEVDYAVLTTAIEPVVAVGARAQWELVVTNNGPHDGHGVLIEDVLPAGLANAEWTCTASGQAACSQRSGTGPIQMDAIVYSGANDRLSIVVTGEATEAGELTNTASVTAIGGGVDRDDSNNASTATVAVRAAGAAPVLVKPVPLNAPWTIAVLMALLGIGARVCQVRHRPR